MNSYELSRQWFDWANEHPELNSVSHAGFMFWLIELNNRLGWKQKFGLPTLHTMEVLNIRSYKTFKSIFDDLVSWGFVMVHQKATNNHTANIIELVKFTKSNTSSLTTSLQSQVQSHDSLTDNLSVDIDKPIKPINNKTINIPFNEFWNLYDYKKGKKKASKLWEKLSDDERTSIIEYVPSYVKSTLDKKFRQHPATFLNQETWEDEIIPSGNPKNSINGTERKIKDLSYATDIR